jgi:hypothetical protein
MFVLFVLETLFKLDLVCSIILNSKVCCRRLILIIVANASFSQDSAILIPERSYQRRGKTVSAQDLILRDLINRNLVGPPCLEAVYLVQFPEEDSP